MNIRRVQSRGRIVGRYCQDNGVFVKEVKKSEHLMRKLNAYGIDLDVLEFLERNGCQRVHVYDEENRLLHLSHFNEWRQGRHADFGHGLQSFVSPDSMKTEKFSKTFTITEGVLFDETFEIRPAS